MAKKQQKQQASSGALSGKRVFFTGSFGWDRERRLPALARANGANPVSGLKPNVDYLVLSHLQHARTLQKKAQSLNAKGATIQIIDADDFEKLANFSDDDVLRLMRGGKKNAELFTQICGFCYDCIAGTNDPPKHLLVGEKFDSLDLTGFRFDGVAFEQCSFAGCELSKTRFDVARDCNFSKSRASTATFGDVSGSSFAGADLGAVRFEGEFKGTNFSNLSAKNATFNDWNHPRLTRNQKRFAMTGSVFRKAKLEKATFEELTMDAPDFSGATLPGVRFGDVDAPGANFSGAVLADVVTSQCKFPRANFARADLRNANLAEVDLTDADFTNANLAGCNLRGAVTAGAKLDKARGYSPEAAQGGVVGPALTALDKIASKAKRLEVVFRLAQGKRSEEVGVESWSGGNAYARTPQSDALWRGRKRTFSAAMLQLANALGDWQVRFETISVKSTKASQPNKELRELALQGVQEAFGQSPPDKEALAQAAKAHREKVGKKAAAEKKKRDAARAAHEKRQEAAKAKAIATLTAKAGAVSDLPTFMKAIEVRTDKEKVKKATKMLKASGFQLFNDVTPKYLNGIVKSQTDPDLVYACRITDDGHYACCTQNLNICGGLRGSICKHLLVLIIGLVNAGLLDPTAIDGWVAATTGGKPELDKEVMGEIFIRYKGAEAGDIDWRPTETVPEDYYAL